MLYLSLMFIAGCLTAIQSPVNAALSRYTGILEASLVSFAVGTMALAAACLLFGKGSALNAMTAPAWQWTGGLLGAVMVCSMIISVPRIGVMAAVLAMILGNLVMAAAIDNYGWFDASLNPFNVRRAIGLSLVLAGLFFIFKK